jgi:hypothetical protein
MSDLSLQLREVWKQPDRLPAEGRLGSSENTSKPQHCVLFVACFALFAYVLLVWHSEPSMLILTWKKYNYLFNAGLLQTLCQVTIHFKFKIPNYAL